MFWIVLIIAALFFSWRNYKKNKPLIAARIAEEKEKDRLKDLRRDTRRRQWALNRAVSGRDEARSSQSHRHRGSYHHSLHAHLRFLSFSF